MTGLDTNVLVRYLTQDDPKQSPLATDFIETTLSAESPGYVNQVVLCELIWVLEECYQQSREDISRVLNQLLQVVEIHLEDGDTVRLAMADFRDGKADFSDHLLARRNLANGCLTTYTFDKKAATSPGFTLLT